MVAARRLPRSGKMASHSIHAPCIACLPKSSPACRALSVAGPMCWRDCSAPAGIRNLHDDVSASRSAQAPRRVFLGPLDLIKQAQRLPESWRTILRDEFSKEYFINLAYVIQKARRDGDVYPPAGQELAALRLCEFDTVRVVIVGQDPYPSPDQANGLAFSVQAGTPPPPSLLNIFKELESDEGVVFCAPKHGCLKSWAAQGVLLLNTCLTVQKGRANSHKGLGWEKFTSRIIHELNMRKEGLVFMLWGRDAQLKCKVLSLNVILL
jgi:uracil-DNA glycosylase